MVDRWLERQEQVGPNLLAPAYGEVEHYIDTANLHDLVWCFYIETSRS